MHSLGARRTNFSAVAPESTLSAIFKHHLKTDLSHRYRIELFSADNSTHRETFTMNRKSLSFRVPEKTPMKKKQKEELDILTYGKHYKFD